MRILAPTNLGCAYWVPSGLFQVVTAKFQECEVKRKFLAKLRIPEKVLKNEQDIV